LKLIEFLERIDEEDDYILQMRKTSGYYIYILLYLVVELSCLYKILSNAGKLLVRNVNNYQQVISRIV